MNVIELHEVGKRYRMSTTGMPRSIRHLEREQRVERWALKDVSLEVQKGETLGLAGQNGSGKSTLLRIVAGLTRASRGDVRVTAEVSGLLTIGESFHPLLSGEENALTAAILAGLGRREAKATLAAIAAFAELEDHMDKPLRTYSDGMRLRLAFATSINVDPRLMLIDEILAVGDLRFQDKCFERLRELQADGVTIVLASHNMAQIRRLCTRAVWLSAGSIRLVGEALEVCDAYEGAMTAGMTPRELPTGGTRYGSGEIEITGVRLLDRHGVETHGVRAKGALSIEIDYIAKSPVDDPIFGVSARSLDGTVCLDFNTLSDGHLLGRINGAGTIKLHFDRIDLAPGSYRLDVGSYRADWGAAYDYLWQAYPLDVVTEGTSVVVESPHKWSHS